MKNTHSTVLNKRYKKDGNMPSFLVLINKKERINRSFVRTMFLIRALLRWKPVVHD